MCVLIAVPLVVSEFCLFGIDIPGGPFVVVASGTVWIGFDDIDTRIVFFDRRPLVVHRVSFIPVARTKYFSLHQPYLQVGLTYPFVAVLLPTLFVWWFVPKHRPGHCQRCGYDLTGLTEPRCPECGQPFEAKGDAP